MAAKNDITGDSIQTRGISDAYRDNYDLIFGKKKKQANIEEKAYDEEGSITKDSVGESDDGGLY